MKIHNLKQGSPEWLKHRQDYDNASDLPAAAGVSTHKTRTQLLDERLTGLKPDQDAGAEKRFADGHIFEELARKHIEIIFDIELSPMVVSDGSLSASLDGINFDGDVCWEHKTINEAIRKCETADELSEMLKLQMDQQMLICGAERTMLSATKWDKTDEVTPYFITEIINGEEVTTYYVLLEEKHLWYTTTPERKQAVIDIWAQFHRDLANHTPAEPAQTLIAAVVETFPMVTIQVRGEVISSNLDLITSRYDQFFIATQDFDPETDQEIVDADVIGKASRDESKKCRATAQATIDQILPISDAVRILEKYAAKFDALGLKMEKAVKDKKDTIKKLAILEANNTFDSHLQALEAELGSIKLTVPRPDFAEAIKGLKKTDSLKENIAAAMAQGKIKADAIARDLREKMTWFKSLECPFAIFADMQTIIYKPLDDFKLTVTSRIAEHEKAMQESAAKQEAIRAEVAAKAPPTKGAKAEPAAARRTKPTAAELTMLVAAAYKVSEAVAQDWLYDAFAVQAKAA